MQQDKDTTGVNFQMKNELYTKMKIKLAMDQETIKDFISHLVERELSADKRITKQLLTAKNTREREIKMNNHFKELDNKTLKKCFEIFKKEKHGLGISSEPLRSILDMYTNDSPNGILMMNLDLFREIAERTYTML